MQAIEPRDIEVCNVAPHEYRTGRTSPRSHPKVCPGPRHYQGPTQDAAIAMRSSLRAGSGGAVGSGGAPLPAARRATRGARRPSAAAPPQGGGGAPSMRDLPDGRQPFFNGAAVRSSAASKLPRARRRHAPWPPLATRPRRPVFKQLTKPSEYYRDVLRGRPFAVGQFGIF